MSSSTAKKEKSEAANMHTDFGNFKLCGLASGNVELISVYTQNLN